MIQDINPHRYDLAFSHKAAEDGDYIVALRGGKILLTGEAGFLPTRADLGAVLSTADLVRLFSIDDTAFYYLPEAIEEPSGFVYEDAQSFRWFPERWLGFAGITAHHLASWYAKNRYCGCCREPMSRKADERALHCPACGNTLYPAIAPAVIVAITDGTRLLVTRYANRGSRNLALVAGFMEVGETFEDTVRREVMEEVGLKVRNIRYYKSQPWGFSGSVLAGFFVDLDGSPHITVDTGELEEALWLERGDMEQQDTSVSLTSTMMDAFRRDDFPR